MTSDICNAVDDALIPSELQLIDIRDNKVYWVAKLADKNCWMTQNLDLASETALDAENTDVDSSYIESFTTSNNLTKTDNTIVLPASSTSGFNTNNYSYVYNSNSTDCSASNGCYSYYSWDAATLGSGRSISADNTDAPYSICPLGWMLPTTTNFFYLVENYGSGESFYNNAGPSTIPNFLLGGYYHYSSLGDKNTFGIYWSSTSVDSNRSGSLGFNPNLLSYPNNSNRRGGFAVRCLVKY